MENEKKDLNYYNSCTIEDRMKELLEQHPEWKIVESVSDIAVTQFLHSNGKQYPVVAYQEAYGEINWPDGFEKQLEGKTLEQQMECYAITEEITLTKTAYGEITDEDVRKNSKKLADCEEVKMLIVREEQLVGVVFEGYWEEAHLLPNDSVCTYYDSDNEGTGYNEREDYACLICVPETTSGRWRK